MAHSSHARGCADHKRLHSRCLLANHCLLAASDCCYYLSATACFRRAISARHPDHAAANSTAFQAEKLSSQPVCVSCTGVLPGCVCFCWSSQSRVDNGFLVGTNAPASTTNEKTISFPWYARHADEFYPRFPADGEGPENRPLASSWPLASLYFLRQLHCGLSLGCLSGFSSHGSTSAWAGTIQR